MKVYINSKDKQSRELVEVEVIHKSEKNLWVKLPDGNIIKRKKSRDLEQTDAKE
jgi:hypothetical protein